MLGIAVKGSDAKSVLSPTLLPTLFSNKAPNSPLRSGFIPDSDSLPLMKHFTESQGEHIALQNHVVNGEPAVDHLPDLTDAVIKEGPYPIAHGGYSDVWRGTWNRGGGVDDLKVDCITYPFLDFFPNTLQIAVKVLRNTTSDPATKEKLIKVV
jgi:hypothetical protein